MSKTYFEKLKDPRWQKKRLEALEASKWTCATCGDTEETLHVHHRQYFKGREPWEYEVGQLEVLCEPCHKAEHDSDDKLLLVASYVKSDGPAGRASAASVLAGYCALGMTNELVDDPSCYVAGEVARRIETELTMDLIFNLLVALEGAPRWVARSASTKFIEELTRRAGEAQPPGWGASTL